MDKFIVRLSILVFTLFIAISLFFAWNGILLSEYDCLLSCSLFSGILLNTLVYSQGKYHCVYMRGLCGNLIFTPSINFIDAKYGLFEDAYVMLMVLSAAWIISATITLILAISHFIKAKKILRGRYGMYKLR